MEDLTIVSTFCKTLTSFCNHLQSSTEALKESMERRPIPLDSASSTFLRHLNRRVSSASSELELLESMTFGTVSFEELLGHCNEFYEKNQSDLLELEDRFKEFGYIPEVEIDEEDEDEEVSGLKTPESKLIKPKDGLDLHSCGRSSIMKRLKEDPLLDESFGLQHLGLSDVCLATLASEGDSKIGNMRSFQNSTNYGNTKLLGTQSVYSPAPKVFNAIGAEENVADNATIDTTAAVITVLRDDYEKLPSFTKSLVSWEDLGEAVEKMNSILHSQKNSKECNYFHQDKLSSLGLGPKVRSYLLMLLHMNRLVIETVDGSIVYRVL